MRRLRSSQFRPLLALSAVLLVSSVAEAGLLGTIREKIRSQPAPTNRDLRGPAPFAPVVGSYSPFYMVEDPLGSEPGPNASPSSSHRFGAYGAGPSGGDERGPTGGYYDEGGSNRSPSGNRGGGPSVGSSEVTSAQLNREFAEAGGITPNEAGANDEDDEFDFDNDSAQVPASGRQQKKSNGGGPANRRKGGYDAFRFRAGPSARTNGKPGKQPQQFAQDRQNDGDREPSEFFPYREFGEQPDRDTPAEYEEYGDYTENLGAGPAGGEEGGRDGPRDPDLDADRPGGPGGRDPSFDFDYDEERGEREPEGLGLGLGGGRGEGDGLGDGRGPGGGGGFPAFGPEDGEREEGAGGDDRVLNEAEDIGPLGLGGGPGGNGGGPGGRGSFFGLRNRNNGGNGRPGANPSSRFSIFGRGR